MINRVLEITPLELSLLTGMNRWQAADLLHWLRHLGIATRAKPRATRGRPVYVWRLPVCFTIDFAEVRPMRRSLRGRFKNSPTR